MDKPKVYLASPVFKEIASNKRVSQAWKEKILSLWEELNETAQVIVSESRFPSAEKILSMVQKHQVDFIGCHLSHPISFEILNIQSVKGIATSTAGYNHISMVPGVLITHTPSVLDKAVADYTIALILTCLRNLVGLHNFLWEGHWSADQKWDLDENLNNTMDNLVLGIVGMGEIGREITKRLAPWGIKILYYDLVQLNDFERMYPNVQFIPTMEEIFTQADIVSLHIPLNNKTKKIIGEKLLKLMKPNSLLVNTARGPIVDFDALIRLLKKKEITINLAFDVYDPEPISKEILKEFHAIAAERPDIRFVFIPHNASSDADTRAEMATILLSDLITMVKSKSIDDLKTLRLIPEQRKLKKADVDASNEIQQYRIKSWWVT